MKIEKRVEKALKDKKVKKLLKKASYVGAGLLSTSKIIAGKAIKELEKQGKINASDAKEVLAYLKDYAEEQKKAYEAYAKKMMEKAVAKAPFASKADLNNLKSKVSKLEKKKRK